MTIRLALAALVIAASLGLAVAPAAAIGGQRVYADARRPDVLEVIRLRFNGAQVSGRIDRHRRAFDQCGAVVHTSDPLRGSRHGREIRFTSPRGDAAVLAGDHLRISEPGTRGTHVFSRTSEAAVPSLVRRFDARQAALSKSVHYPNARVEAQRGNCK